MDIYKKGMIKREERERKRERANEELGGNL